MSSEQNTIPGITRRLMFNTLAKTSSKYLEMDADITWTLNSLPLCYSLNHAILNFRVVNVTSSGGKYPRGSEKSECLSVPFSAVPCAGGQRPRPLGVASPPPHNPRHATPAAKSLPEHPAALRFYRGISVGKVQHTPVSIGIHLATTIDLSPGTIITPTLQAWLGG